jgi:hypothetical protein
VGKGIEISKQNKYFANFLKAFERLLSHTLFATIHAFSEQTK